MSGSARIDLASGTARLSLSPANGGTILSWDVDGVPVLRPSPATPAILDTACFPLLPFANRIARGRFAFEGREIVVPDDPVSPPHALHGVGWRRAWTAVEVAGDRAVLRLDHDGSGWPWPFIATEAVSLSDHGLRIGFELTNLGEQAMPVGFGVHPYFPSGNATVELDADRRTEIDADALPIGMVDDDRFRGGRPVAVSTLPFTDHFYATSRPATLRLETGRRLRIDASRLAGFQLYAPVGGDFFCVEPQSHRPNAFAKGDFDEVVSPGATARWEARFDLLD
ncbi:hypothetical protein ABDK56_10870 [Sphingomonas sp. ASV193]|uniref:aldose epimerase family protein n=1 Tax=Sphingomonas sp. ASV193 TaxID=3144405 RepID=UPI0032E8D195